MGELVSATLKHADGIVQFGTDYSPLFSVCGDAVDKWLAGGGVGVRSDDAMSYEISENAHLRQIWKGFPYFSVWTCVAA